MPTGTQVAAETPFDNTVRNVLVSDNVQDALDEVVLFARTKKTAIGDVIIPDDYSYFCTSLDLNGFDLIINGTGELVGL